MDKTETKLNIMRDILIDKENMLEQVYNICFNQQHLVSQLQSNDMIKETSGEKQKLIDKILKGDDMFQNIFNSIKDILDGKDETYNKEIKGLQKLIASVMDWDIRIRNFENENKTLLESEKKNMIQNAKINNKSAKNYILNQYKKNTKRK